MLPSTDNKIYHPKNSDFYLCAHAGMIGTTRHTHYHVFLDQIGYSADDLQELVYTLLKEHHSHICCGPDSLLSFDNVIVRAI